MFTKRIHVFKAGDQTSAQGVRKTFTPEELQQVVDTYDPSVHEAPLVLGHQGDNDSLPSFGWIQGFSREGQNLYADVSFTDAAKDLVKNGHYRKVSISFYSPDSQINPHTGKWSARHLALLGASPPAVKGLEPFSFSEEGCFDFAVSLEPGQIFDDELGPTLLVEKSPLEVLREKLEEVRKDVSSAVQDLQKSGEAQTTPDASQAPTEEAATELAASDENQQFTEGVKTQETQIKTNTITQQTAELEDQFPEEQFMENGKISRKRAKGAHGQVVQVVENLYDEQHKELPPELQEKADEMKAKAKAHPGEKVEMEEGEDEAEFGEGDNTGRFETARSSDNGYADRMKVGKEGKGGVGEDRDHTAKDGEQEADRLKTAKSGEQDADRDKLAKDGSDNANGESRWAGQADAEERVKNGDQYDADTDSYPEGNKPKTASGSDPAGRGESDTKVPTETEESPDNEVFAVSTINVMSDGSMRVIRQKSGEKRAPVKGGSIDHAEEEEADESTSEMGVTAMAEGEKKAKDKHLTPGAKGDVDEAAETVGPDGAFAEEHSEKKNPYTKTGFGSTYGEDEEEVDDESAEEDYNELSTDHCSMSYKQEGNEEIYAELERLKREHSELQRRFAEEKTKARKEKIASFVESLYEDGRLTDGVMPQSELQSYCEGLDFGTLEFSEGETAATKLLSLLSKLPPMVSYGEFAAGTFQYAEEDLDPHAKALAMVEKEGIDYVEAIKRTMYG